MIKERTAKLRQLSCDTCHKVFQDGFNDGWSENSRYTLLRLADDWTTWLIKSINGVEHHFCCEACYNAYRLSSFAKEAEEK